MNLTNTWIILSMPGIFMKNRQYRSIRNLCMRFSFHRFSRLLSLRGDTCHLPAAPASYVTATAAGMCIKQEKL